MNPWVVLPTLVVLAVVFVMVPVCLAVYGYYRRRKLVRCPVTRGDAVIQVNAREAAFDAMLGSDRLSVAECSLWPARRGCSQACVRDQ